MKDAAYALRCLLLGSLVIGAAICQEAWADKPLQYNRDIRSILADNCFACHGPDSASRKADLRLDKRDAAIEMAAITPGDPDSSVMLDRIFSDDPDEVMPPPAIKKTLTAAQKETLRRWIAEGAEYEPHWSFIAPVRPEVPSVSDAAWVRNPIDAFVLAKLDTLELKPAPEADRHTLARRLSLDLTGLPPKPELVAEFVADTSPQAYEKLVDKLLESPHWGEHRGRYWLDAARYADTHGIHFDNFREIWAYRDWVIHAFNRNLPFDQFTIEQLAGDLLPNATIEQKVASGFNRCNITTNEGGVIAEEYLVLYTRDRTETTSLVWMGLTAGCAVCHDHKFDPISQREFYEMAAFFNNTTQGAMDGNIKNTPPVIPVPQNEADYRRTQAIPGELAAAQQQLENRKQTGRSEFDKWLVDATPDAISQLLSQGLELHAKLNVEMKETVDVEVRGKTRPLPAGSLTWGEGRNADRALHLDANTNVELADVGNFDFNQPFTISAWVKLTATGLTGPIIARMNESTAYRGWDLWVQNNRIGTHLIHSWPQDAIKTVAVTELPLNEWRHVTVTYDGSGKVAGLQIYYNGEPQPTQPEANEIKNTSITDVPLRFGRRSGKGSQLANVQLQDVRIYSKQFEPATVSSLKQGDDLLTNLYKPAAERTETETAQLYQWWLQGVDQVTRSLNERILALNKEQSEIQARSTVAHVMNERAEPAMAYILHRGEYDQRRDEVKPKTLAVLPPMADDLPRNRLGFAQWLLTAEHPLTARVTVNRFWQEVFGTGLVRTAGDFGVTGELPANQELLDWLAVEFRESGWDIKKFFKLLVMSNTYRQAAITTPEKLERDEQNRYCSRGPRYRMDAEMVRDYALAASGLLVPKIGGPSVKPYQPPGVWEAVAMIGSNTRDYKPDTGENLYRRSMYTFWKRSAPPASLDIFNAPNREVCTVRRERTNTPLQALVTLNDPQFIEAGRVLAAQVLQSDSDDDARLQRMANRLLARDLRDEELVVVKQVLTDLLAYYAEHADDAAQLIAVGETKPDGVLAPATLAAWTMVANQLMNLDELLNK
jgi:hypothetical protein